MPRSAAGPAIVHPQQAPGGIGVLATFQLTTVTLLAVSVFCLWLGTVSLPLPGPGLAVLHLLTTGLLVPLSLAAAVQLTVTLHQAPPATAQASWGWLPWLWLAGNLLPVGFLVGPWWLAVAGGGLLVGAVLVACRLLPLLATATELGTPLRLGLGIGVVGNVLVLASGTLLALSLAGVPSRVASLGLHLTLALGVAYVPLLIGVSGQLFPMFGHLPPDRLSRLRTALLVTVAAGGLLAAAGFLTGWSILVGAGAMAATAAILGWALRQEALIRRGGRGLDSAAAGGRLGGWALAVAATATAVALVSPAARPLLPAAAAFGLVSGLLGSILSYARRISAFLAWHTLFRRFGRTAFIPKLDQLRPPFPARVAPWLWTLGGGSLAVSLYHPFFWSLWPLAAGALAYALEMGWSAATMVWLWARHRMEPYRP